MDGAEADAPSLTLATLTLMFKRAVITDEISQDFDVAVKMARDFHLDGLEIRTAWDVRIDRMTVGQLNRVRDTAVANGLAIASLASPVFKCALDDPGEVAENFDILKRCIDAAHALGTDLVRAFTFWRVEHPETRTPDIAAHFREAARIAADGKVRLIIENEHTCNVATSAEIDAFLTEVATPTVRALWDPCNAFWSGEEDAVSSGYDRVKAHIAHVHVKDSVIDGGKHVATVLGEGEVGVQGQLDRLLLDGYAGYVSLETHYRVHAVLDDELVKRPGGSAFSAGGEEGTRRCLVAWNAMRGNA
ncbi:MAG: sugar phosphate isomerase/epimerase [Chloroflexi bacterium]|nr:sugar phosphate isomerase/epimerase [Chloroflexota bacterium]